MDFHFAAWIWFYVVSCLFCCSVHEGGHVVFALYHRVQVKAIGIRRMGIYLRRARTSGWAEVSICLAGVLANLLVALVIREDSPRLALCQLVFGAVNLAPIRNSDLGHAWQALVAMRRPAQQSA
jgi:hypothetical protein